MLDFCRTLDSITLEQEADLIIQQLDILFDTTPGEVLGDPNYGADYDKFIHELNISAKTIEDYVKQDIRENVELFGWDIEVEVKIMLGMENDIILMGIQFSKEEDYYTRIYKMDSEKTEIYNDLELY